MTMPHLQDMGEYVREAARAKRLVVQPRMGFSTPAEMAAGLRAVASLGLPTIGTITLDSYTRVGDHAGARNALLGAQKLNGFPLVVHGPRVSAEVAAAADGLPVQVRHGSAAPGEIFTAMAAAGLSASEGGPISYCLPYGRVPLAESVAAWKDATALLVEQCRASGRRAHLETFGGCLLGQLCPPSLLVAVSILEALFFCQHGAENISLSYTQQTHAVQDIEALSALRTLAEEYLPAQVDRHIVLYAYMGVFPRTPRGAQSLLHTGAEIAVRGGAERMIVKTLTEAHRIPTIEENLTALRHTDDRAQWAHHSGKLPWSHQTDPGEIITEARILIESVISDGDVGASMVRAFREGLLDVPFCLHADNQGLTRAGLGKDGRVRWERTGKMPITTSTGQHHTLRSEGLLRMLNFTADTYDLAGTASPTETPQRHEATDDFARPHRIAVIGVGPRGLAVLERTGARLAQRTGGPPVELYAIDACEPGPGRIWRPNQPEGLLMNTPAGEVTMFSGPRDGGAVRPGAGPSLAEWWQEDAPGEDGGAYAYAPRRTYGRYLRFVLDAVQNGLPDTARLHRITGRVNSMARADSGAGWLLRFEDGRTVEADRVVLATGHSLATLSAGQRRLADFAEAHPYLRYVRGDSAADMPLHSLPSGRPTGILGLGLAFYDVTSLLTEGRGGRYITESGKLRYIPSGREPRLIAGSRSGVPLPARGRNQKRSDHTYQAMIFTRERIDKARSRGKLDFNREVLPWLIAEICLVYYSTDIRVRLGQRTGTLFIEEAVVAAETSSVPEEAVARLAVRFGSRGLPPVDLENWANPFALREFTDHASYQRAVIDLIREDLLEAEKGNADGPTKAALDTLRDVRSTIRASVDLAGLTAQSHREEFLSGFVPVSSHLSAGPPMHRLRQLLALMESGILHLVGPQIQFGTDPEAGRFTAHSAQVLEEAIGLDALIDARIPTTDIRADTSDLIADLLRQGIITSHTNTDQGGMFDTGGLDVTAAPYHPVNAQGQPVTDLYALGIPTEHARWFTQVGSSRPGAWGEFTADADAIAEHLLSTVRKPLPTGARYRS